jgi:UvrD/REP helicase N-terminal domain/UvrD-like helicase C-terminal domain
LQPTAEQERALKLFRTGQSFKINAYAGTGKTSTLVMLSRADKRKGLYIAFNRPIVNEAKGKFDSKTACMTTHELALKSLPARLRRKAFKSTNAAAIVQILGLEDQFFGDKLRLTAKTLAFLIMQTIREFCQGTDETIRPVNFRRYGKLSGMTNDDEAVLSIQINLLAEDVWSRMISADDMDIQLGHDGYLKLWALSKPQLNYDYILLDEAQDTNPVVLGVLKRQSCQIVYVGDAYQQIYEWRGAVNAMALFDTAHSCYLTKSFRFGEEIAEAASSVLSFLGAELPIQGNPNVKGKIGPCDPDAILARTNSTVMSEVIAAINAGKKCHIIGGTKELVKLLKAVIELKNGRPSDVPELFGFANWSEVEELVDDGEADNLMTLVNLVRAHGEKHLLWALRRTEAEESGADIVISTVFKAKGREWDKVRIASDFLPSVSESEKSDIVEPSEARVFYVAITRGRLVVDVDEAIIQSFLTRKYSGTVENIGPTVRPTKLQNSALTKTVTDVIIPKQALLPLGDFPKREGKNQKRPGNKKSIGNLKEKKITDILAKLVNSNRLT